MVDRNRGGEWEGKQWFEWWIETGVGNGKKTMVSVSVEHSALQFKKTGIYQYELLELSNDTYCAHTVNVYLFEVLTN